jgi:hypothetical protein
MQKVHVGRPRTRGALSVFPVWGEVDVERDYAIAADGARVSEMADPRVDRLIVANTADRPLVVLEGQLLKGGLQNRMVAQSVVVTPHDELAVAVVCVERGRWGDRRGYDDVSGCGTTRVRSGMRLAHDRQGEVWRRVSEYDAQFGPNATSSFTEHASRASHTVTPLVQGLRPFPGQIGVVIAISGQPVSAELFDSPLTLAERFPSIVAAAAMDAVGRPSEITPSRRALRFIDNAAKVDLHRGAAAGAGVTLVGRSADASISLLRWRDRDVHTSLLNPRHELVGAS